MADGQVIDAEKVGSVLVVGAGIGGMQASLDLADSGFRVYLTDSGPAIGGTMAQLDKTFPTNDCAMCIMSPKLVETGRHLNISVMTLTELESISGQAGNFSVRLRRQPRFVDVSKCTGCGDCAAVCPIVLPDAFNAQLSTRKAVYKLYPQAIPNAFAIQKRGEAPCRNACPIEQRAMGYIALIREGRFADAYRTIREDNPFPAACGRVCNHRCEEACSRPSVGETPVSIMRLKRFVSDWARAHPQELVAPPLQAAPNGHHVAVVGSGPAGLTCAGDLAKLGYQVTVFEALPVAGGMMRVGIPAYRLPYDMLQKDIDDVLAGGVELVLNHRVDDVPALLQHFNAVFVALGAHLGARLPMPGVDLPDVLVATDFLRGLSLGEMANDKHLHSRSAPQVQVSQIAIQNRRVLVIGGGNVAVDAAMSAVRLGASWVGMACLESRQTMPAHDWEVRDAAEEGIEVMPSRTFKEITGQDGRVTGVRAAQVDFRGFVEGRPDFDEIAGTEELIPCDVVIFAIGQKPDLTPLGGKIDTLRGRTVAVDPDTLATSVPGIFSGGDAVSGTSFVVDAIAAGHKAARAIDAWLCQPAAWPPALEKVERLPTAELDEAQARALIAAKSQSPRAETAKRPAAERKRDFDEIEPALSEAQAIEEARRCLECGICSECLQCVYACRADAIRHDEREQIVEMQVGAVILTPGLKTVAGDIRPEFGYGLYPNVVTSLEFERMLSASGPYAGVVQRPSDGHHPRKVAFIQCVGSRDLSCGQDYCSSVCCMYATKEALIAREHDATIEPTIFYMDIRAFGKGFERYYQRAEAEQGVRYVRSMVSCVKQAPGSQNLRVAYATPDGKSVEEEFDLVVLSVGLLPSDGTRELARRLGVQLDRFGFAESLPYAPTETNVPGIYVAGAFAAPKDIPETVIEASCAAAHASRLLAPARGTLTREPAYPAERDVSHEEVRVGVFVCHCGINIGGVVRVPEVVEYVQSLPNVAYAEHNLYTCSQDTQERIKQRIQELGLNRVVVSSCTPRTHEPLFQDTIRQAGLNPYLFELANIREQDSWVHRADRDVATEKAKDLAAMAVAKAAKLRPLYRQSLEIDHRALVLGGGLAGMTAALSIAEQGYDVHLVERENVLGGNLRHIYTEIQDQKSEVRSQKSELSDPQALLADLIERVSQNPRIHVYLGAEVDGVSGYVGQYKTGIRCQDGHTEELGHGVVIVATGAQAMTPKEYLYGQHPNVITQVELEAQIRNQKSEVRNQKFIMLQCVGSRDDEHPYCSRVCCTQAIKNALVIKQQNPQASVVILYRDIRTYGMRELLYRQAREAGVVFLEYSEKHKPAVTPAAGGALAVELLMQPDGERITLAADWVVLSTGIEPRPDNAALAQFFKLPLSEDCFFLEAHAKLRPLDFAADGVYLAGLAHSPRFIDETIAQANGAALRAVTLLSRKELQSAALIAEVNPRLCSSCGVCVAVCPYNARLIDEDKGHAVVLEVLCQGCGACVSACPNGASFQRGFEFGQIFGMIDAALERV
ncbi:MAG: FAD-dependent oxidoreductase [Thermoflexales bacterium]|nr:FAD-dependent oxidoreductase [Thermoflexales bacterium]